MKRRLLMLVSTLCLFYCAALAEDNPVFRYVDTNRVLDFSSGNDLEVIHSCFYLENIGLIKNVKIKKLSDKGLSTHDYRYSGGLIQKKIEKIHETYVEDYLYDEKSRLIQGPNGWKYMFPSDFKRETYYNNKLAYTETVESSKNYMKITKEEIKYKNDEKHTPYSNSYATNEYFYENGVLKNFVGKRYKRKDNEKKYTLYEYVKQVDFVYEKGLLVKVVNGYGADDVRYVSTIKYDDKGNMTELEEQCVFRPEESSVYKFSNYDRHGNWLNSYKIQHNDVVEQIERVIEYY